MQNSLIKLWVGALLLLLPLSSLIAQSQRSFWEISTHNQALLRAASPMKTLPTQYQPYQLNDLDVFHSILEEAPLRFSAEAQNSAYDVIIPLPMPDGKTADFKIFKFSVMAKGLANKFPGLYTYSAIGIDDPNAKAKVDITHKGFHAMILSPGKKTIYIDPIVANQQQYMSYYRKYFPAKGNGFECHVEEAVGEIQNPPGATLAPIGDCQLRQYRLALACTGEYAQFQDEGNIMADVMAAFVTTMNRVNGVFEQDAGITMEIVANNDLLIFTNASTDPYDNEDGGAMLGQNQTTCDNLIGSTNYDIGHVFGTDDGGIASLQSPCSTTRKARGVTGQTNPVGDPFDINYVAHEMGHQFGGNHTQNNNCNRSNASVEPGSASTIMGYAGICFPNVQTDSDDYFHAFTLAEFAAFAVSGNGNSCATILSSANNTPTADAGSDYIIPVSTPFELTATGFDADGDALSYCWEQMDNENGEEMPPEPTNTMGPNFRSYLPTLDPVRTFPNLSTILFGSSNEWEILPSVFRIFNFTVSVRDNNAGYGCVAQDEMIVTTTPTSGPFIFTYPSARETWVAGETRTLTWDVANTDLAPVLCSQVDILFSTDGGFNFNTIATDQPNNGTYDFLVPDIESAGIRFKIACSNNIFFTVTPQPIIIGLVETCTVFNSSDIPINISENGAPTITSTLSVNMGDIISSVSVVNLTGDHSFSGDLAFTLIHPNGEEISLLNNACGGNDDFNLTFSDGSGGFSCPLGTAQTVSPSDPLSNFAGLTTDGIWTLRIDDQANLDGGSLNSWGLEICTTEALSSLPVELMDFTATAKENQIDLNWQTANERDNAGFEIHRSIHPNRGFTSIGWVTGFGTNNGQKYTYPDLEVVPGTSYFYQLKQIDYDEKFELSDIVSARLAAEVAVVDLHPNPVRDQLTFSLALEGRHAVQIFMIDILGRIVLESTTEFQNLAEQNFDLSHLTRGIYFLNIELETGEQMVRKIVKE